MRAFVRAVVPALLWAGIVLYIGGLNSVPAPRSDLPLDKVAHFTMYGVLGLLAARVALRMPRRIGWWWFIAGGAILGILDEFRQSFIPTRSASPLDWVADTLGFSFGFWLAYRHGHRIRRWIEDRVGSSHNGGNQ